MKKLVVAQDDTNLSVHLDSGEEKQGVDGR